MAVRQWTVLLVILLAFAASMGSETHSVAEVSIPATETAPDGSAANTPAAAPSQNEVVEEELKNARMVSNESSAIGWMRTIVGAQTAHHAAYGYYASLKMLCDAKPAFLDASAQHGRLETTGYLFTVYSAGDNCVVTAVPLKHGVTGSRHFFTDASGVIRVSPNEQGLNREAPPLGSRS
jgi:hypothetical protein